MTLAANTGRQVPCPTAHEALCQAMVAAVETLRDGRLAEADFGRFADLDAGWYWRLKISHDVTSEHPHLRDGEDTLARRTRMVIESWKRRVAYYEQDFTPGDADGS